MEPLGFQIQTTYLKEFARGHCQTPHTCGLPSTRATVQAYPHIPIDGECLNKGVLQTIHECPRSR